jgi:hypothetical protein
VLTVDAVYQLRLDFLTTYHLQDAVHSVLVQHPEVTFPLLSVAEVDFPDRLMYVPNLGFGFTVLLRLFTY